MAACLSGLQALSDAQLFRRTGLPAAALGVKELQIKQEEGKRQPGDFARVLGPIAATMPLRNASHASRPVVKVEPKLLQCVCVCARTEVWIEQQHLDFGVAMAPAVCVRVCARVCV